MIKQTTVLCVVVSSLALAAPQRSVDAFLGRADSRSLVDERQLTATSRAALRGGVVSSMEPRYGVPTFFWSSRPAGVRSFKAMGLTAVQAARRYLFAHAELYRGDPVRWAEARVARVHDLRDGSAVIVAFQLDEHGVKLFRDEVHVVMTSELELVALSGYLTPERKVLGAFSLHPESAIASAYQELTGLGLETSALKRLPDESGYLRFALGEEPTPVRARTVYFPTPDGLVPGFYVELELSVGTDNDYESFVISAVNGAVLYRKDLKADDVFSYRVWADSTPLHAPLDGPMGNDPTPYPTATPSSYSPPYVPTSLIALQNGPISTNDPWLAAGATLTRGNNANAYADIARSNGLGAGDVQPIVTSPGVFDRTYDVARSPNVSSDQRMAAVTQLFYDVNFFHDWYYDKGFNEASGNAQAANYGRGGADNDAMNAEGQDYSGRNNANMSTPSDGASPRMQMYIFDGSGNAAVTLNTTPAQTLTAGTANFGPQSFNVTANVVLVNDGDTSGGGTTSDACTSSFTTSVSGKIALIDRGSCTFILKVQNAAANGAVGVIIADNTGPTATPPPLYGTGTTTTPSLSVTLLDGDNLKTAIAAGTVSATLSRAPTLDRDGTIDNAIVAHEWGHYISNRLIGDGNGLSNNQANGMGEGWGDFHAMLLVVKEADATAAANANWAGVYGLPGYAGGGTDPESFYFGFRRVPYSTDMSKNGLTFKHIQNGVALPPLVPTAFGLNGANNAEVHNTGEVWATMLWECYAALLRDTPRLTFAQAQDRMRGYLVAAYKATALMPTFVDARDALLAVAAANDPADFALFWQAFAKRGLGMLAVAPDRDSQTNSPLTESFVVGNAIKIVDVKLDDSAHSCDNDGILDNDEEGQLVITVQNIGVAALAQVVASVTTTSPGVTLPAGATVNFPNIPLFATSTARVRVALRGQHGVQGITLHVSVMDPTLIGGRAVTADGSFRVNYNAQSNGATLDDVEAPTSQWTVANDPTGNTGSDWRIFQSTATSHWWFGPDPSSPADTWLISPNLVVGTGAPFVVTFKHRYDFEKDATSNYDGAVIETSADNGATWLDVGSSATPGYNGTLSQGSNPLSGQRAYVGKSAGYPNFITETVNLGTSYAGRTVKFRFRIGSDDAAAAKGWEVDDIDFQGITNKPFTTVVNDPNTCSTNHAPVVTVGPSMTVDEGTQVTLVGAGTDPDGDTVTLTWTQKSGPAVALTGATFTAPRVDADTQLSFELSGSDGVLDASPATLDVLVKNVQHAPVASVPAVIEVNEGDAVVLQGTGTDADGDTMTYTWTRISGPEVELTGQGTDKLTFTAPQVDANTVLAFDFVVSDGTLTGTARAEVLVKDTSGVVDPGTKTPPKCGCASGLGGGLAPLLGLLAMLRLRRRRG